MSGQKRLVSDQPPEWDRREEAQTDSSRTPGSQSSINLQELAVGAVVPNPGAASALLGPASSGSDAAPAAGAIGRTEDVVETDSGEDLGDSDWDGPGEDAGAPGERETSGRAVRLRGSAPGVPQQAVSSLGGFDGLCFARSTGSEGSLSPSAQSLRSVTQEALEWLLGTHRAGLLRLPLAARALATKDWLTSDTMSRRLAKSGQAVPTFAVSPVHFFSFQWPCSDLLRSANVDAGKSAEWAHASARWYLDVPGDHSQTSDFLLLRDQATELLPRVDAAASRLADPAYLGGISHSLYTEASSLMTRFFALRGARVAKIVKLALASPLLPPEHRSHVQTIGRAYQAMPGEFREFLPRFAAALHADSRPQGSSACADRFTGECWVRFFRAFCRGILGGALVDGPLQVPAPVVQSVTGPPTTIPHAPPPTPPPVYQPSVLGPACQLGGRRMVSSLHCGPRLAPSRLS